MEKSISEYTKFTAEVEAELKEKLRHGEISKATYYEAVKQLIFTDSTEQQEDYKAK